MESPTGVIPEELMYPAKKAETIAFIEAQPWPAAVKRNYLAGWARWVGIQLKRSDFTKVERTGIDV